MNYFYFFHRFRLSIFLFLTGPIFVICAFSADGSGTIFPPADVFGAGFGHEKGAKLSAAVPIIVNHACCRLADIPSEWVSTAKANLHIAYGHTSHGSQLITGMTGLVGFRGTLYSFNNGGTGGALDLKDTPFSGASDLGNPDFTSWETATRGYLSTHSAINVVIWSWCGQVSGASEANINTYLSLMNGLESSYPSVKFVYMTGHLDGSGSTGTLNVRNEQIRTYCRNNNKILFDFADIESYDPDGLVHFMPLKANDNCDYDSDGNGSLDRNWATVWQGSHTLNVDWFDCSPAHSQALNGNLKAYAAWHLWARLAGWQAASVPPAPAIASAAKQGTNQVKLSWNAVSGAAGYNVYRGTAANFTPDKSGGTNRIGTGVTDQDAGTAGVQWTEGSGYSGDFGTNCFYVVTAVNAAGESANSNRFGEFDYALTTTATTDFNEIALPLSQPSITSAQQLMAAVPNCNSVARWSASSQGYEQYVPALAFTNFSVQMGYPYYVNVTSNATFSMFGEPVSPTFDLVTTAKTDFNEIMLTLNKTSITKASGLMTDIPNCNSIAAWNAAQQGYVQYVPALQFTDFDVRTGYPYYVNMTASGAWPSGGSAKRSSPDQDASAPSAANNVPHAVWGKYQGPERFNAFVVTRPDEILTETSAGCYARDGAFLVQCASFPTAWTPGEKVRVVLRNSTGEAVLTNDPGDELVVAASNSEGVLPETCGLEQNFPNPFNPETTIRYTASGTDRVLVIVRNVSGQPVRILADAEPPAGIHEVVWDGRDDQYQSVSSGLYIVSLKSGSFEKRIKCVLMR